MNFFIIVLLLIQTISINPSINSVVKKETVDSIKN